MGADALKGPGLVTTGLGVANTSLAGHPTKVVIITRGTVPNLLPHLKVGIQQQGTAVRQTNSSRHKGGVIPAGLGQVPMLRFAPTAVAPGARSNFYREGFNKIT